jgi:hypothetical protein
MGSQSQGSWLLWRPAQESNLGISAILTTRPWPDNYRYTLQSNKHSIYFKCPTVFYTCTHPGFALVQHKLTTTNLTTTNSKRSTHPHPHTNTRTHSLRLLHPLPPSTSVQYFGIGHPVHGLRIEATSGSTYIRNYLLFPRSPAIPV